MIFEVDPHPNSACDVELQFVNWIKEFRHQTGLGLKESKTVGDFLRASLAEGANRSINGKIIIDTNLYTALHYLDDCAVAKSGRTGIIRLVNFDIRNRTTSREEHARLTSGEIAPKAVATKRPATANDILKTTAIRLVREGFISEARQVLKILM